MSDPVLRDFYQLTPVIDARTTSRANDLILKQRMSVKNHYKTALMAACAMAFAATAAIADPVIKPYFEYKQPKMITIPGDISLDTNGVALPSSGGYSAPGVKLGISFEGVSQYDGASFGRNFIPPDTMGAVGKTQYMETTNGAYAVFDKATGTRTSLVSE